MNDMTEMERWYAYGDENGSGPWNDDYPFDGEIERWHTDEHGEMHSSTIGYQLGICQNCDKELPRELALRGTLFCSEKCQQTAKAVRYGRATLRDGRFKRDPLVREALDTRIAIILGAVIQRKSAPSPASNERPSLCEMTDAAVSVERLPLI